MGLKELTKTKQVLKGESISGKPLIEIAIDNEPANEDIKQAEEDPSITQFPLMACFD